MLLIFVKDHCLLKNNWTLISVNNSMLPSDMLTLRQLDINHQKLVSSSAAAGAPPEEGPVNSGPPPLAPEGDQQFSAGCLASVLTH